MRPLMLPETTETAPNSPSPGHCKARPHRGAPSGYWGASRRRRLEPLAPSVIAASSSPHPGLHERDQLAGDEGGGDEEADEEDRGTVNMIWMPIAGGRAEEAWARRGRDR